jgi:hypothetical protein
VLPDIEGSTVLIDGRWRAKIESTPPMRVAAITGNVTDAKNLCAKRVDAPAAFRRR